MKPIWTAYSRTYKVVRVTVLVSMVATWPLSYLLPTYELFLSLLRLILASCSIGCDVEYFVSEYQAWKKKERERLERREKWREDCATWEKTFREQNQPTGSNQGD